MKQILMVGKIGELEQPLVDYFSRYFGVQTLDMDLTAAGGMIGAMKPNLLLLSADALLLAPMMTLTDIRKANPEIPTVSFGKVDDFVRFEKLYVGDPIENINLPLDEDSALFIACSKMKVSMKKVKVEASGKKKILVVDDDATTLRSFKSMLENKYEVQLANSGEKALESVAKTVPDLILLDFDMPGMSGKEMIQKLRENKAYAAIPVIFVTSVTDKRQITTLIPFRPSGYLLKPVSMDVLSAEIEKSIK